MREYENYYNDLVSMLHKEEIPHNKHYEFIVDKFAEMVTSYYEQQHQLDRVLKFNNYLMEKYGHKPNI